MAQAQVRAWDLGPHDVIAQYASIGFDATISEIFTAFLSGASLAVLDSTERLGKELVQTMITLEVTTVTLPPSLLNIYAPADFPTLKKVIAAGEACSLQTAIKWTSEPRVRFFNAYGPTETTVCATIYEFVSTAAKDNLSHDLPIGKAIDGVQVYLFDSFMRQVPPDVVGEIYIGGLGVSAGYIGHAVTKNKECFVTNPLNILLYKTGDYAIQGSDGNLTYVGRLDDQVKIRGQRVDLGEIEQVILQHSKVDMAVVVKYQGLATSDACIAAFVAPRLMRTSELREYLTKVLPKYMMPTCIKKMNAEDFPLTLNGKVDRRKLERDDDVCKRSARVFKSYLKPTELRVATLWCKVLQIDVDHANNLHSLSTFHELGGNSLHMVLLQKAIEKEFKVKISFTEISDICTIEKCVDAVRRKQGILKTQIASDTEDKEELKKLILQDSVLGDITTHVQDVRTTGVASFTTPKNIILTGATGFLGAFLLHEILEQSEAFVICMVRESSESRGLSRVVMNMEKYHLWKPEYKSRISVVFSDLSLPQLGIPDEKYKTLCRTVDTLYLNAAMMNFNTSYRDHRQTNVLAMKEFITFAFTGRKKFIFMTSSLAVFLFPPKAECHAQVEPLKKANPQSNATANGETADDHETRRFSCTNGFHFHLEAKEKNDMEVKTRIAGINDEMSRQAAVTAIKNCITLENCMKDGQTAKNVLDDETKNYEEEIKYTQLILNGAHATEATLANSGGPVAEVTQFQDVEATDSIISEYIMAKRVLFSEDDTIDNPTALSLGYCQSKWASEKLVLQALQQLPGGAVFRPARICGHSMTGVGPTNDLFAIMVTGMGKLGLIPDVDFPFDLIPVDFCAKGMVEIMLQIHRDEAKEMPQVYHFFNKSTVPFIEIFEDTTVQKLPLDQWREELESIAEDNPLLPLIPFFNSDFFDRSCDWPKFDTSNTDKYISQKCKQMLLSSREHLKICKQYFALNVPQVMNKQLNIHDKCFSN